MIFKKPSSKPDIKAKLKHDQTLTEKEKRLFLGLCSADDRNLLLGKKPMSAERFQRLYSLMDTLGLEHYSLNFALEQGNLMEKLTDSMEKDFENGSFDLMKDIALQEKWIQDFLEQLPNETLKKYIGEIFLL